jgi:hypothetical protein
MEEAASCHSNHPPIHFLRLERQAFRQMVVEA